MSGSIKAEDQDFISIWQFFDKTGDESERKAACRYCNKMYCYKTTIYNLKHHLLKQHSDDIEINPELLKNILITERRRPNRSLRVNKSIIWKIFERSNEFQAICSLCKKTLTYKTNLWNLMTHIKNLHNDLYEKLTSDDQSDEDRSMAAPETLYLTFENHDDDAEDNSSVWDFFERTAGGRLRCLQCRLELPAAREDKMAEHIRQKHTNVVEEEPSNNDDDDYSHSETDSIVERFYKNRKTLMASAKTRKRNDSSSDEEVFPSKKRRKKSQHDIAVDNFAKYLSTLLKHVPPEQFAKLQLDILNLVMATKINKESNAGNITTFTTKEHKDTNDKVISESNVDSVIFETIEVHEAISKETSNENTAADTELQSDIEKENTIIIEEKTIDDLNRSSVVDAESGSNEIVLNMINDNDTTDNERRIYRVLSYDETAAVMDSG